MLLRTPAAPGFTVDQVGPVTVVRFARTAILEDEAVALVRERLFDLVDRQGRRLLVLNFSRVAGLTSRLLGQVVALNRKLQATGGRLALCEISPFLGEVLESAQAPGLLCFEGGEPDAVRALAGAADVLPG